MDDSDCTACVFDIVSSNLCYCFSEGADCDENSTPASCLEGGDSCFGLAAQTCSTNTQEPVDCDACVSEIVSSDLCHCLAEDAQCDESAVPPECYFADDVCFEVAALQCGVGTSEPTGNLHILIC